MRLFDLTDCAVVLAALPLTLLQVSLPSNQLGTADTLQHCQVCSLTVSVHSQTLSGFLLSMLWKQCNIQLRPQNMWCGYGHSFYYNHLVLHL